MRRPTQNTPPLSPQQPTATKLIREDFRLARVVNLMRTEEGGYASVFPPGRYLPIRGGVTPDARSIAYGTIDAGRKHLIVFETTTGFKHVKRAGEGFSGVDYDDLPVPLPLMGELSNPPWPTQYVATPTGMVIVPQGGRAYFWDGEVALPLGYSEPPGPPLAFGPESSSRSGVGNTGDGRPGANDSGYAADGLTGWAHSAHRVWKHGRLGTVSRVGLSFDTNAAETPPNRAAVQTGYLLPGRYRAVAQYVDRWGNLSPVSGWSSDLVFEQQPAVIANNRAQYLGEPPTFSAQWGHIDLVRKQVAWGVGTGPEGTIARLVGRTKDLENSGDVTFYELPLDAADNPTALATLPDNVTTLYTDNIPDAWLVSRLVEVDPVPMFRLATMAFGRLWISGVEGDMGAIMGSIPGRWGTFPKGSRRYPDPRGATITGIYGHEDALYVFTAGSMFRYVANSRGDDLRQQPVSMSVGCVAPSSIQALPNGMLVWLAEDGFYGLTNGAPAPLWKEHQELVAELSRAWLGRSHAVINERGEYVCWVATRGSESPSTAYVFDGNTWHEREDMDIAWGSCAMPNRRHALVCGKTSAAESGVFALDTLRRGTPLPCRLDTGWLMHAAAGAERHSVVRLYLRLREYRSDAQITVRARRDHRAEVVQTQAVPAKSRQTGDLHEDWTSGGSGLARIRRPAWVYADIHLPSFEAIRLEVLSEDAIEIVDAYFEAQPHYAQGGRTP